MRRTSKHPPITLVPFQVFSLSEGEFGSFPSPDSEGAVPMCLTPCLALIPPLSPSNVFTFLTHDNRALFSGTKGAQWACPEYIEPQLAPETYTQEAQSPLAQPNSFRLPTNQTCVKPSLMRLCLKVLANFSSSSRSLGSSAPPELGRCLGTGR